MINTLDLVPGDRIVHVDGRTLTVVENMGDGQWIEAAENDGDDPELVHSQDIARMADVQQ